MSLTAYTASTIFSGTEWLTRSAVLVEGGQVVEIVPLESLPPTVERKDFAGCFLAPAFIDIQLYGAHGRLLAVDPSPATLAEIVAYCKAGGAVLCLPTVATNTLDVFSQSIDAVRRYWEGGGEGVWGLHLEGPWLNPKKRGAHIESFIHSPSIDEVTRLLDYGKDVIRMITLAPEVCSGDVLSAIRKSGVIISAGHSNAGYAQAMAAFDGGITTVTHLYNAMSPLQHREPGLVGAVFSHGSVRSSIIADGYHVDFAAIKIAKTLMGDRLFVITDAVTETSEGLYPHHLAGDKYECNGTLSGSAITMFGSYRNLVHEVGIEAGEALRMCSLYPAEVLGCAHIYGKIAPGYAAQFVVIDKQSGLMEVITAKEDGATK
jgi:N-acetylglucosamine-6-phosphate deacetylase